MSKTYSLDSIEALLLRECYDLATQYEKSDISRDLLREKLKRLDIPQNPLLLSTSDTHNETEMQIITESLYGLTLEGYANSENTSFRYDYKVNALPQNSAEREYLFALLSLRNGTNETQRSEALRHLILALELEPNDPRYLALAAVLQQVK